MAAKEKPVAGSDAITAIPLTAGQQVRLECAKLVYRHDRSAQDAVARAAEIERYVLGDQAAPGTAPGNDGQGSLLTPV